VRLRSAPTVSWDYTGGNEAVDFCSGWYTGGEITGIAADTALGGAGAPFSSLIDFEVEPTRD